MLEIMLTRPYLETFHDLLSIPGQENGMVLSRIEYGFQNLRATGIGWSILEILSFCHPYSVEAYPDKILVNLSNLIYYQFFP